MRELTITELEGQLVELLPSRETLFLDTNIAGVYASNSSLAVNAGTILSSANSQANQAVVVAQS